MGTLVYELPHELSNNLRLGILGNKEILGRSQIWVERNPSLPPRNQTLAMAVKKHAKVGIKLLSSFTGFLYFVPNIFSRIV